MEFDLVGWPEDGPTIDLDWRAFSYAGKFVMSSTGKAVAREDDAIVGALAFDRDRADDEAVRFRYVTVREDRRGDGIGPALLSFGRDAVADRGFDRARIAVNNAYAYEACYRSGFEFTGETTGLAELVLEWPGRTDDSERAYRDGLERFLDRDGDEERTAFVRRQLSDGVPSTEK